jgi:hypothetical protein
MLVSAHTTEAAGAAVWALSEITLSIRIIANDMPETLTFI